MSEQKDNSLYKVLGVLGGIVVLYLLFGGFFLSLVGKSGSSLFSSPIAKAEFLSNFEIWITGAEYKIKFSLQDNNLNYIRSSGTATLTIYDSNSKILYKGTKNIYSSDFEDYYIIVSPSESTGTKKTYGSYTILKSLVSKSIGFATAELKFTTPENKQLESKLESVYVEQYTDEEIKQISENEYNKNCKTINQVRNMFPFEITLIKLGKFSSYYLYTQKDTFRIDLKVKNYSPERQYFVSDVVIVDDKNNQYEMTYGGTFNMGYIYPNVIQTGSILFDPLKSTATKVRIIITKSSYPNDIVWQFDITL